MFRLFKKKKKKPQNNISENGVTFIHHNPERGNIGDFLCSPRHYFEFIEPNKDLSIVGGGVFVDFGYKRLKSFNLKPENSILWASGLSLKPEQDRPAKIKDLKYQLWGLRDIDLIEDSGNFLPCSSCLHSMLNETSTIDRVLLFINADPKVTSTLQRQAIETICKKNSWDLLFNNCTEEELINGLRLHSKVITNSYHGTYWSLLSGKEIVSMGYSSKFISLAKGLGLDESKVIFIKKGCGESLINALQNINFNKNRYKLEKSSEILAEFRKKNISFAEKMIKNGLIKNYNLKH